MEELLAVLDDGFEDYVNREFPAISADNFKTIEMMVKLRRIEQSLQEIGSRSDAESREDYKKKTEEISRYLTSIKPIVGRMVTGAYHRKIGLCN